MKMMHNEGIFWGSTLHPANFIGSKITDVCLENELGVELNEDTDIHNFGLFLKILLTGTPDLNKNING